MHKDIRPLCSLMMSSLVVLLDAPLIGVVATMVGHICGLRMSI